MTDKPKETRAIVLLEDVDKLGVTGELVRTHPTQAGVLVDKVKARWATKADFDLA